MDRNFLVAIVGVFLIGSILGGAATFGYMEYRLDSLEEKVDNSSSDNVVYINGSTDRSLNELFQNTDQSVVSVTTSGGENAQASGFIYSSDGYIITNEHVVSDAETAEVTLLSGNSKEARIVGTDPYTDLAVLKIDSNKLEPLALGDSSDVEVGQKAAAIGNPFGLRGSMTSGIISQKGRTLRTFRSFSTPNVLQTDAAINPGNSGGPLLNTEGEVIGVNTAISTQTGTFSGVGFAIPSNTVEEVIPRIIEDGKFQHPWIGVSGVDLSPEIADEMGLENATGFMIVDVVEDSPADKAGVQPGDRNVTIEGFNRTVGGDVIVGMDGERMRGINDILLYLSRSTEVGQEITLEVIRDGERIDIPLTLESRESRN